MVCVLAGAVAVGQVADVALDEVEPPPLQGRHEGLDGVQIAVVAGGKVVQADHVLVELQQGLQQVAAQEAGHAGDEPAAGLRAQLGLQAVVGGGRCGG